MHAHLMAMVLLFVAAEEPQTRPNVLMIAIDDLNDWVGVLKGHPQVKTPNIDRLAERGTLFTNAHCQAPLCNPSRTSLLTGLRPTTTGVYSLDVWFRNHPRFREHVSLPQCFMRAGYNVLVTGKIFHDSYPPKDRRDTGVEASVWGPAGHVGSRPAKKFAETPDPMWMMDWGPFPDRDEECFDFDLTDWAGSQLHELPSDKPFFLSVGFRHPHVPCFSPQKWFDLYPKDKISLPAVTPNDRSDTPRFSWYLHWKLPEPRQRWLVEANQWQSLVRSYLASVSFVDAMVGRVLDALDKSGRSKNTIVVLWSDHGWHLGEKGMTGKTSLWDRSTRVPLVFAGPGIGAGRCEQPAELLDVYPTLGALCGVDVPAELEGESLVPQLRDVQSPRTRPAVTTHGPQNHAVRTENWRYIRYGDGSEELYDMKNDPNEWTNLADRPEHADTVAKLSAWIPTESEPPLAGSRLRLIEIKNGHPYWEGRAIEDADQAQPPDS